MKRISRIGIILCILLTLAMYACADTSEDGNTPKFGYRLSESGEATVINCTTTESRLEIPAEIDGHAVVAIGEGAFFNYSAATEIVIPDGVREIGKSAFEHCTNLTKVTLSKTVEKIGEQSFGDCFKLEEATIPDNSALNFIGINAFSSCRALKLESYGGANYLKLGTNGHGILISAESTSLESAEIHPDTEIIAGGAFSQCASLTEITIPQNVRYLGNKAFYGCTNLDKIYFNAKEMKDAEAGAAIFERVATKSETMTLYVGAEVERIPAYLMESASRLRGVSFADGAVCEVIGKFSFANTPLPGFTLPAAMKRIEVGAFSGCAWLADIKLNAVALGDLASDNGIFSEAGDSAGGITLTVGSTTERIPAYFCSSAANLKEVKFENNGAVKSIGANAFLGCEELARVSITDKSGWCETNFENEYSNPLRYGKALLYINDSSVSEGLILTGDITFISDYAFAGYKYIEKIVIPDSVVSIGANAFYGAENLYLIYWGGSRSEWESLSVDDGNSKLYSSTVYYYSETAPMESGNFWRYEDGVPAVWINSNV